MTGLVRAIILVPTVAAVVGLLARPAGRTVARLVAVGGLLATFVVAILAAGQYPGQTSFVDTVRPLAAGELRIPLQLQASGISLLIAAIVALVGLAVQVYSVWYLADDDRYAVFAATVSLFCAAMLLLVLSSDLVLTLIGWEVMGWCSYLLIGHWSGRASARRAAHKAFVVTRVADVGFLLGVVLLAVGPQSTTYDSVLAYWADGGANASARTLTMVLLVIGVLGKSAMVPFQDWLPDAMEGPTPASALIHAATMVAAGTFVMAQLQPVLAMSGPARWVLGAASALTMLLAAVLAFGQSDIKRLLAWSTVSQVAVMLSAIASTASFDGALAGDLHLYAHALFKALLFLAVGWMGVLAGGTSAAVLRGAARRHGLLWMAVFFGLPSLVGIWPTVGWFSKEQVIDVARASADSGDALGRLSFVTLLVTVVATAAYAARAFAIVGAQLDEDTEGEAEDDTSHTAAPRFVEVVVGVLLFLTVLGTGVNVSGLIEVTSGVSIVMTAITTGLAALGALGAWRLARVAARRTGVYDPALVLGSRQSLWDNGFGADALYHRVVARPVVALAHLVADVDDRVVDATARYAARLVVVAGRVGVRLHRAERPATGLVAVVAGALAIAAVGVLAWR